MMTVSPAASVNDRVVAGLVRTWAGLTEGAMLYSTMEWIRHRP